MSVQHEPWCQCVRHPDPDVEWCDCGVYSEEVPHLKVSVQTKFPDDEDPADKIVWRPAALPFPPVDFVPQTEVERVLMRQRDEWKRKYDQAMESIRYLQDPK